MALNDSFISTLDDEDRRWLDEGHDEGELDEEELELELDEEEQEDKDRDFCLMDEEIVSGDAIFIGQVCAIDDIIKQIICNRDAKRHLTVRAFTSVFQSHDQGWVEPLRWNIVVRVAKNVDLALEVPLIT